MSHACKLGYLSLLKQLSKSTNITIPEILEGKSPLHAATAQDNPELVIFLLKEGCGVNVEDSHGRTALYEAIRTKNKVIAKVLIGAGGLVRGNKEEITNLLLKYLKILIIIYKNKYFVLIMVYFVAHAQKMI